jgi:hypothetical protein
MDNEDYKRKGLRLLPRPETVAFAPRDDTIKPLSTMSSICSALPIEKRE